MKAILLRTALAAVLALVSCDLWLMATDAAQSADAVGVRDLLAFGGAETALFIGIFLG